MLTLVFLRFIGEKFEDGVENLRRELSAQGLDSDDPAIRAAFLDDPTFTTVHIPAPGGPLAYDHQYARARIECGA